MENDSTSQVEGAFKSKLVYLFITILAVSVGCIIVVETGINVQLSLWTKHQTIASFIAFFAATIISLPSFILCTEPKIPKSEFDTESLNISYSAAKTTTPMIAMNNIWISIKDDKKNMFALLGGPFGALLSSIAIYTAPLIGFSLFFISFVIGQICSSVMIDGYGLIWSERRPLSWTNRIGAILTIIGVVITQVPSFMSHSASYDLWKIGLILLAMMNGCLVTMQASMNRRLQHMMNGSLFQASFLCFLSAAAILLMIVLGTYIVNGDWFEVDQTQFHWYIFFGGVTTICGVNLFILCPIYIGFTATFSCAIFGSLVTSLMFDAFGVFGVESINPSIYKICGSVVVLLGGVLANKVMTKKGMYLVTNERSKEVEII